VEQRNSASCLSLAIQALCGYILRGKSDPIVPARPSRRRHVPFRAA